VVRHLEAARRMPDFHLAIGDDRTDEDLFAAMGPEAWTIHVGAGPSQARFQIPSPADVHQVLAELAATLQRGPDERASGGAAERRDDPTAPRTDAP